MILRPKTTISTVLTVLVASLAVVGLVIAGTTIGTNYYSTGGALFDQASTTALQVQNGSGTAVVTVDTANTGFKVTGSATTTLYGWLGTGGTANWINYTGGDLYVQDDAEIDDKLFVTGNTSLAADLYSTDGALFNVASTTALDVQNGSGVSILKVDTATNPAGVTITGQATTTTFFTAGTTSWAAPTNTVTVAGTLYTTGNATTSGDLVVGGVGNPGTTSLDIISGAAGVGNACITMRREGTNYRVYINSAANGLLVEAGECE